MKTIRELFARDINRKIEEVIKVDQADEATVRDEIDEYVVTESIRDHYRTVYKAIAEAPAKPHEGIGVWVSGFFGAGKSSFAKILGYTVSDRKLGTLSASKVFTEQVKDELIASLLENINRRIPTHSIIFDVSMERGVRTANERITEIMYKALLRELGYSEDFDVAQLEIDLESDGKLDKFIKRFETVHAKPWEKRRKLGFAVNEASRVLHEMDPVNYPQADSWARSIGEKGRADITPNLLAERAYELTERRKKGSALIFIIDEVGQYIARSEEKMLDIQGVIQAFGREGKNRVNAKKAPSLCWIVVTSQEKLNEVVDSLESKKIQLAKLQDRFPVQVDLKQSDISEVVGKRVLAKNDASKKVLESLYDEHEGRLKECCSLERTGREAGLNKANFVNLYPYLPYQIDLCIQIVAGLRLKRGVHRHIGGSNRTIIKQAQEMMINPRTNLSGEPVGTLVTLDRVYELLYLGNLLPSELSRDIDAIPKAIPNNEAAHKVAKAIALLEVVKTIPRTAQNIAAVLHPTITGDSQLKNVEKAIKALEEAQFIRETDEGYKLLTIQEKNWDTTRSGLSPKPAEKNRILREAIGEIFSDPKIKKISYKGMKTFRAHLTVEGEVVDSDGELPVNVLLAVDDKDLQSRCDEARKESSVNKDSMYWVMVIGSEMDKSVVELYRSREMVADNERLAAHGKLSAEESSCLSDEKVRKDRYQRELRSQIIRSLAAGSGFFRAVQKDGSSLGKEFAEIFTALCVQSIPDLYPKLELGVRPIKGDEPEKFLLAANLNGLSPIFYEDNNGLGLVSKQGGKFVPNITAPICREVLDYLKREHSYGNKITGKTIENYFTGIGYGWDRDILRLVLAVLLRGGAIEVTHQGRKYRTHADPACRAAFNTNPAFRAASFAPREALDIKTLAEAVRQYEEMTGREVDVEEGAIAQAFQKIANEDREKLLPLTARMSALDMPGTDTIKEFLQTVEGVIDMAADDCVRTLAGEGKSYRDMRERITSLEAALTDEHIAIIKSARTVLWDVWPIVSGIIHDDGLRQKADDLALSLHSDDFHAKINSIRDNATIIWQKYSEEYIRVHDERQKVYAAALDEIRGMPEWAAIQADSSLASGTRDSILMPFNRCIHDSDLASLSSHCKVCNASMAQLESDGIAVDAVKRRAIDSIMKLAEPEEKVERVKIAQFVTGRLEKEEDIDKALEKLKEHLLKLIATGSKIILE